MVSVYDFYGDAYAADDDLQWAAMGRLAGAPVYAALQDLRTIQASRGFPEQAPWLERKLLVMQQEIFEDLGWQHRAYLTGGIDALRAANRHGRLDAQNLETWEDIASGEPDRVADGNRELLYREQFDVLQEHYEEWPEKAPTLSFMTSRTAASPIPEGSSLDEAVPASMKFTPWPRLSVAEIHDFDDRWDWIGGEDAMWGDYQYLLDQPPRRRGHHRRRRRPRRRLPPARLRALGPGRHRARLGLMTRRRPPCPRARATTTTTIALIGAMMLLLSCAPGDGDSDDGDGADKADGDGEAPAHTVDWDLSASHRVDDVDWPAERADRDNFTLQHGVERPHPPAPGNGAGGTLQTNRYQTS